MSIERLLDIMARLRDPEHGCPWDVEQTFETIAPYTIEEAYEVADAIDRMAPDDLKDELGDLLFQVVFHAQMAREMGWFGFADVVDGICSKMERRHPHVFGDEQIADARAQTEAWERHKAAERATTDPSALAGVARGLPEWLRALKLQKRAARIGFDWPESSQVLDKMDEEQQELRAAVAAGEGPERLQDELGDVLFTALNFARKAGLDAGAAMRHANAKFERRFRQMETRIMDRGETPSDLTLDQLEQEWQAAKAADDPDQS